MGRIKGLVASKASYDINKILYDILPVAFQSVHIDYCHNTFRYIRQEEEQQFHLYSSRAKKTIVDEFKDIFKGPEKTLNEEEDSSDGSSDSDDGFA